MRERIISRMVLVLLVIGLFVPIHDVCPVWATGTIYIRADGSIEPPTAPISTSDKITYTFTSNTSDMLVLERDNIVVEGAGQTIKGASAIPGSGEGITLEQRRNVVVRNIQVESFACGIWVDRSSNITVTMNNMTACHWGIYLGGIYPYENGSVNNKMIRNNITYIPYDGIGIVISRCLNNTISQNDVSPVFRTDSGRGISLSESANNSVSQNSIRSNHEGISLVDSGLNNITDNSLWDNIFGILLDGSSFNSLVGNDVAMGIWHDSESGEPILMGYGITIRLPYDSNMLRNNNITGHKYNFGIEGHRARAWDNGYPSGGNYWSNYNGTDANHDGIGDTPYIIDANNTDSYPLIVPFAIPEFPLFFILPLFMTATSLAVIVYRRKNEANGVI